jgi:hypothetical protein
MPVEQCSTTSDIIDTIQFRLESAHRPFAGAQVRVAFVPSATGLRFLTGTMLFGEQKLDCRTTAEYRQVRLVEFWIDGQESALEFLSRFLSGQESISGVSILNTFTHSTVTHNSSEHAAFGWPSWIYATNADLRNDEQRLFLEQQPTVSKGLAPFRSPADAVRYWVFQDQRCDAMAADVPYQEQFLIVIPDTRARFISGRWSACTLDIALEINTLSTDLELQIRYVGSGNRSANYPVGTDAMIIPVPGDAREILLYVVHKTGDLICMHWMNSVHRSFGSADTVEPEGVDHAQSLQSGENEIREFKPFISPTDTKELEIVKSTVAFANTDGGTIFVGVDDEGVPLGIAAARRCFKTLDPIEAQMSRLKSLITNNTKPVPSVTYTVVDVNGSRLVVVEVKKSPTICSTQDNRVYVRRGSTSRLADPNSELPSLIRGSGLDFESSGGGTYGI